MITFLLIVHALVGVALLGGLTHQATALLRRKPVRGGNFIDRYSSVNQRAFSPSVAVLYLLQVVLGAAIYPAYRLQVRIPFEEMSLGWAVGLFELKEHYAGLGVALLPFYVSSWRSDPAEGRRIDRDAITLILTLIVWWDFIVGHVLNNIRGLA